MSLTGQPPDWRSRYEQAVLLAQSARFADFLALTAAAIDEYAGDAGALMAFGSLVMKFGYLDRARKCFVRGRQLAPNNGNFIINLANLAHEAGDQRESSRLYAALFDALPNNEIIRRNVLLGLEYDPAASPEIRYAAARDWGSWAIARAGGPRQRPPMAPVGGRALRIGYLSSDFCQHTVGLFIKDVLAHHDRSQACIFAYSAGQVKDWVTGLIARSSTFREVGHLDDGQLADQIRQDGIDILVDLSGHTAGSRLSVLAYRPAPVQVSWLGYFATTGLPCVDAVLLDEWHAPPGMEAHFVEPIVRLPRGRLCYTPVPFAPNTAESPSLAKGYITFGCFNNTAKLNQAVFEVWAALLHQVPNSRLVLKWRTFQDDSLGRRTRAAFEHLGIAPERIELRGASFHADLLRQYADIDIALDPFPFTGGLTSCEALWMGVPLVTWPQDRVVSRQTYAALSAIGLQELAAKDGADYVRIGAELARDQGNLTRLRDEIRTRMQASPLMDVYGFAKTLEAAYRQLYLDLSGRRD